MAMAMRLPAIARAATEMAAAPVGLRRLFCSNATNFSFLSPQANSETPARPQADPSTNLFVSGNKRIFLSSHFHFWAFEGLSSLVANWCLKSFVLITWTKVNSF